MDTSNVPTLPTKNQSKISIVGDELKPKSGGLVVSSETQRADQRPFGKHLRNMVVVRMRLRLGPDPLGAFNDHSSKART